MLHKKPCHPSLHLQLNSESPNPHFDMFLDINKTLSIVATQTTAINSARRFPVVRACAITPVHRDAIRISGACSSILAISIRSIRAWRAQKRNARGDEKRDAQYGSWHNGACLSSSVTKQQVQEK
jgi:hypothetical protein